MQLTLAWLHCVGNGVGGGEGCAHVSFNKKAAAGAWCSPQLWARADRALAMDAVKVMPALCCWILCNV